MDWIPACAGMTKYNKRLIIDNLKRGLIACGENYG